MEKQTTQCKLQALFDECIAAGLTIVAARLFEIIKELNEK